MFCALDLGMKLTYLQGPLEIYRVPGSVSFLHSGTLLHAILPRSQCWCVDGVSTFVFRVLAETYYRIELPGETEEDVSLVEQLKVTLQKVLHYERTACPFKRGFSVELPLDHDKPRRRKSRGPAGPAKKWRLDRVWRPEGAIDQDMQESQSDSSASYDEDEALGAPRETEEPAHVAISTNATGALRPGNLDSFRSVTAPPQLTLRTSPPSKVLPIFGLDGAISEVAHTSSANEQHAMKDMTIMPPTPESMVDADANPYDDEPNQLEEDNVKTTTSSGKQLSNENVESTGVDGVAVEEYSAQSTKSAVASSSSSFAEGPSVHLKEEIRSPPETLRQRRARKASSQRSDSPAQSGRRLYRSTSSDSQRALTDGLVRKTCSIFLGPPANLVALMLRIAAKIASGAVNLTIQSPPGSRKRVPGSWDLSEDEDDWDIDDYGYTVRNVPQLAVSKDALGKAWDLD